MKKFTLFISLGLFFYSYINAQTSEYNWSQKAGGTKFDAAHSITSSPSGDIYVTGEFYASASFSGKVVSGFGNADFFLTKYSNDGKVIWVKKGGGTLTDRGFSVAADDQFIYATGEYYGEVVFDDTTLSSVGNVDAFLAKYDTSGKLIWIRDGKAIAKTSGHAITLDPNGNIIVAGYYGKVDDTTVTFNNTQITTKGDRDIYLVKYDQSGNVIWANTIGGKFGGEEPDGLDCDNSGNIYICGTIADSAYFGNTIIISKGSEDAFLAKFNSDGNLIWVRTGGGTGADRTKSVSLDESNNVYVTGFFDSLATFGSTSIVGNDNADMFVAKYNSDGDLLWIQQASSSKTDWGMGIAASDDGCIISGRFAGAINFGLIEKTSLNNSDDIFAARYDREGNFAWVKQFGGVESDQGRAVTLDKTDNIYLAGSFRASATFDNVSYTTSGIEDIFVMKIGDASVPVELASFDYSILNNKVKLIWNTVSETNNASFGLERSRDDVNFVNIGTVNGNGTTSEKHFYSFVDQNSIYGTYFYRLKQINYDGSFTYSNTLKVTFETPAGFALHQNYPNPFNPETVISFVLPSDAAVTMKIFDMIGREISSPLINQFFSQGIHNVNFNAGMLSSGMYMYTIKAVSLDGDQFTSTRKMTLVK